MRRNTNVYFEKSLFETSVNRIRGDDASAGGLHEAAPETFQFQ
jgi:hypothetical protein